MMNARYLAMLAVITLVSAFYLVGLKRWQDSQVADFSLERGLIQDKIDDSQARYPPFPRGANLARVSRAFRDLESENTRLRAEVVRRVGQQGLERALLQVDDDVRRNQHARRPWSWRNLVYPASPRSSVTVASACP